MEGIESLVKLLLELRGNGYRKVGDHVRGDVEVAAVLALVMMEYQRQTKVNGSLGDMSEP